MSSINGISFGGLASGLDTRSIISQLLAVEERPIALLRNKKQTFQAKKSLYGDLEDKLNKLFDATKKLRLSSQFLEFDAVKDNEEKYLKATASAGAQAGKYEIVVNSLAQARTRTSSGSPDADSTTNGSGSLSFDLGDAGVEIVTLTDTTLNGIAASVNEADIGIEASVINTGIGANPYKLVFRSAKEGEDNDFTVGTDSADLTLQNFAAQINADNSIAPKDADLTINGVGAKRSSNTFDDLIPGVTIDLRGEDSSAKTIVTISTNTEETSAKVKEFVDAYNEIVDFISGQQEVIQSGDGGGDDDEEIRTNPLFGESSLRTIRSTLRNIVGGSTDTGNASVCLLSQIGIESDRDGRLTFTQSEFDEALVGDPSALRNLFASEDDLGNPVGIANRIYDTIDAWTDSIDGILAASKDGIDRNVTDINRQIERAEEKLERLEIQLTQRYANLEITLGRLQAQGGALAGLSAGLGGQ